MIKLSTIILSMFIFLVYTQANDINDRIKYLEELEDELHSNEDNVYTFDPLEKINRTIFAFNKSVETLLSPAIFIYEECLPHYTQEMANNFLNNLKEPISCIAGILKLDGEESFSSIFRFLVNTTLGIGGCFDIASELGLKKAPDSLSDTLLYYYAEKGRGPFLILPIIGPSCARNTLGVVGDILLDPIGHMIHSKKIKKYKHGLSLLNEHKRLAKKKELITNTAYDEYATLRSMYIQYDQGKIEDILNKRKK